jgi:hypothetical protein
LIALPPVAMLSKLLRFDPAVVAGHDESP